MRDGMLAGAPRAAPQSPHRRATLPRVLLLAVLWTGTFGGCARETPPAVWQPGNLQPLTVAWQEFFSVEWRATPRSGATRIDGFITNTWGFAARDVRVLVNGFDSSGSPTGQLIAWGPDDIEPGGRVYFDVTVPSAAATYDVAVFSWRWKWPPSGGPERRHGHSWAHAVTVEHPGR